MSLRPNFFGHFFSAKGGEEGLARREGRGGGGGREGGKQRKVGGGSGCEGGSGRGEGGERVHLGQYFLGQNFLPIMIIIFISNLIKIVKNNIF